MLPSAELPGPERWWERGICCHPDNVRTGLCVESVWGWFGAMRSKQEHCGWHTPRGSEQLPVRDSISWASPAAFALLLLLPLPTAQEKTAHGPQRWHSPRLHHSFGEEEAINQSVILRAIKSMPFRKENIPVLWPGQIFTAWLFQKGRAQGLCALMFSLSGTDSIVPAWRALFFSKPNKWQFKN